MRVWMFANCQVCFYLPTILILQDKSKLVPASMEMAAPPPSQHLWTRGRHQLAVGLENLNPLGLAHLVHVLLVGKHGVLHWFGWIFLKPLLVFPKTSIRKCSARFHGRFPVSHRSCSSWRGHGFENLGLTLEASHQLTVRSNKSDPSNWYSIE